MRISSQNNQFIFQIPQGFIDNTLERQFQVLLEKNFIPYVDVISYLNSTIKDIVFPSVSYDTAEQKRYHGKNIKYREAGNVMDKFQGEIDITFRSVDSHLNYFISLQISNNFYLKEENFLPEVSIKILDKDGDLIYTVLLKEVIILSLSELRLSYYATDFSEQTFTLNMAYNFIDIVWEIGDDEEQTGKSVFDVDVIEPNPRDIKKLEKEHINRQQFSKYLMGK
jgi:hypothetical protein